jgi:hypothetical protein
MRAMNLFAGFCLTILISAAAQTGVFAQEPKTPAEQPAVQPKTESTAQTQPVLPNRQAEAKNEERYRLGFQDTIEITVARHTDLSLTTTIAPDGTIRHHRRPPHRFVFDNDDRAGRNDSSPASRRPNRGGL